MKLIIKLKEKRVEIGGGASMTPANTEPKSGNTCRECGKSFPTEKSLCGHMRLHPERTYRGINPPNSAAASKKRLSRTVSTSGEQSGPGIMMERPADTVRAPSRVAGKSLLTLYHHRPSKGGGDGLRSSKMMRGLVEGDDEDEEEIFRRNLHRLGAGPKEENKVENSKKRKASELDSQLGSTERRFECETCGKTFSSPQALGGHKTRHRNWKASSSSSAVQVKEEEEGSQAKKTHVCKVCLKGFPSGQVLGGHQRLHYPGSAAIIAAASTTTTTTVATSTTALTDTCVAQANLMSSQEVEGEKTRQFILGIDLKENQGEIIGCGCRFTTSALCQDHRESSISKIYSEELDVSLDLRLM